jgi:septum formation protein
MLEAAGVSFRVVPADLDEAAIQRLVPEAGPQSLAAILAAEKAKAVSARFPAALVIGADQTLSVGDDDELLNKPGSLKEARAQLKRLRGETHELFSVVALARGGRALWWTVDRATLTMRNFSDAFLDAYLARLGESLCCTAGAYEIEGLGIQLFEKVEGDYFTIIGLPLLPLLAELRARGALPT